MKKWFLILLVFLGAGIFFSFFFPFSDSKKILRVMTYSSFTNVFGPGPAIQKEFEKFCNCKIKWLTVSDSTLLVQRLSLRKDGFKTDVVMGLDQLSLPSARQLKWQKVKVLENVFASFFIQFLNSTFVPYDWAPMSFLSRTKNPDLSLLNLLDEKYKHNISLPSARTSTVGLQFYYWIWSVLGEKTKDFLKKFKKQLYGLPSSWSTSYALFQRGHVKLSFSYLSSLLYHIEQNQKDFHFVTFQEGQPFQVEFMAVSDFCTECELAHLFVSFLLQPNTQKILVTKNYMFSVIREASETTFTHLLSQLKFISYDQLGVFLEKKEKFLNEWDAWLK